ncbi:L-lactate permease [Parapedomonas caeni]
MQDYDPLANVWLSAAVAAAPVVILLVSIAVLRLRVHVSALLALAATIGVAILVFGMPAGLASRAAAFGAAYGLLPIGWLVLNVLFLYQLTLRQGYFQRTQVQIATITDDRRLQLLLIAFCFGAFFEGCAGFGAPVAITAAMLIGLGFEPLAASRLSLIANTAPVAFGSLGTPIIALSAVTGLPVEDLSAMVGRQLPFFSLLIPFWLVTAFSGWRGMLAVWPPVAVAAVTFAVPQYLIATYHGPWLVDIGSALCSILALVAFLRVWRPRDATVDDTPGATVADVPGAMRRPDLSTWTPWLVLVGMVLLWGTPQVRATLDAIWKLTVAVPGLDGAVVRVPPVVLTPHPKVAVFSLNLLSATGTGILLAALLAGVVMGASPLVMLHTYGQTLRRCALPLATIAIMFALGYVSRYSGADSTMGFALATTGAFYPFFGTFIGWLGVSVTGSDTASNVLFGGLQRSTAERLGLDPVLMAAANSSGGVMGKMIDAQSIVVASTATGLVGRESDILRYVFFHSVALVTLVALLVSLQASL